MSLDVSYYSEKYKKKIPLNIVCAVCTYSYGRHLVDKCPYSDKTFTIKKDDMNDIQPWSKLATESSTALQLKRIQYIAITEEEMLSKEQGHGAWLHEKGFYPLGHKKGVIIMSYWDDIQRAIVYEKLVFKRAIPRGRVEVEAIRIEESERLIYFE